MSANHHNDPQEMQEVPDKLRTLHRALLQGGATWREALPPTDRLAQQVQMLALTESTTAPKRKPTHASTPTAGADVLHQPIPSVQRSRNAPPFIRTLGAAVIVILLVGAFAWLQLGTHTATPGGVEPTVTATGIPTHPLAQSPSLKGVTIYIADMYADATRTVLHFFVKGDTTTTIPVCTGEFTLADSAGHLARLLDMSGGASFDAPAECFATMMPFPAADIGTQQTLTFILPSLDMTGSKADTPDTRVTGPWKASFTYAIPAAKASKSLPSPVTQSHITMQVSATQWSHATKQIDGNAGGVRIFLHLTGLPPNHANVEFALATHITEFFGNSKGDDGNGGASHFSLKGAWGTITTPALAASLAPVTTSRSANIGPDGAADIEVIFLIPNLPKSGTAHLTLDTLVVSTKAGDANAPLLTFPGPFAFAIPIA